MDVSKTQVLPYWNTYPAGLAKILRLYGAFVAGRGGHMRVRALAVPELWMRGFLP